MTMRQRTVIVALLVGGLPAAMAQDRAALIQQLAVKDVSKRLAASSKLAAMGDAARPALEQVLHPLADRAAEQSPTEAQRREIAALITQLSNAKYKLRQQALVALVKLGRIATGQLCEATRSKKVETSTRAQQLLDKLYPNLLAAKVDVQKVEAAILLALVGTRKSIPALRHALNNGGPRLSSEAAGALRAILHGGPSDDSKLWRKQRARMLTAWQAFLDKLPALPTGPGTKLKLGYHQGIGLQVSSASKLHRLLDIEAMTGTPIPGKLKISLKAKAVYRVTVNRVEPLTLTFKFAEHETLMTFSVPPGTGGSLPPNKHSLKGKVLVVEVDKDGKVKLTMGGKPLAPPRERPTLHLGLQLAMKLPQGDYQPGQARPLSKSFFVWMNNLMAASSGRKGSLVAQFGKLIYQGQSAGQDRFFLVSQLATSHSGTRIVRMALHGELRFDRKRGILTGYSISGPLTTGKLSGPDSGKMFGAGHWSARYKTKDKK